MLSGAICRVWMGVLRRVRKVEQKMIATCAFNYCGTCLFLCLKMVQYLKNASQELASTAGEGGMTHWRGCSCSAFKAAPA